MMIDGIGYLRQSSAVILERAASSYRLRRSFENIQSTTFGSFVVEIDTSILCAQTTSSTLTEEHNHSPKFPH